MQCRNSHISIDINHNILIYPGEAALQSLLHRTCQLRLQGFDNGSTFHVLDDSRQTISLPLQQLNAFWEEDNTLCTELQENLEC